MRELSLSVRSIRGETKRVKLTTHFGEPVMVEERPIEVAKIPVNGDELHQCILIHPRYAPNAQKITVRGLRMGRTIDVLLDKTFSFEGQEYGVMNFKGVGARAFEDMTIQLKRWYSRGNWMENGRLDNRNRIWGAHIASGAREELECRILRILEIPEIPIIAVNEVPREGLTIWKNYKIVPSLAQLVRLEQTNIRLSYLDVKRFGDDVAGLVEPEKLGRMDGKMIAKQLELAKEGRMVVFDGLVDENRFVDGAMTDRENFTLCDFNPAACSRPVGIRRAGHFGMNNGKSLDFIQEIYRSSARVTNWQHSGLFQTYLRALGRELAVDLADHTKLIDWCRAQYDMMVPQSS